MQKFYSSKFLYHKIIFYDINSVISAVFGIFHENKVTLLVA